AIFIAYKWAYWLINSWTKLSMEAYSYLKIKLALSLIVPEIVVGIFYSRNFARIKSLEFFTPKEAVYGSADWATEADIERANLRAKHGMMLGKDGVGYFVADGFQHALLFAPTGSGK